jgi:polysaccharide biosynthesis/export protein
MWQEILRSSRFCLLLGLLTVPAAAQQTVPAQAPPVLPVDATPMADRAYRLGPGDVIDVRVFGRPEMSRDARIDSKGRIRLPFIEELQAACLTELQLADLIVERYKKYLRDPQVDVMIKDYRSQPVAVIGAIARPGQFQLQRRVRLLELLSHAGGPNNIAGNSVHIIHSDEFDPCAPRKQTVAPADGNEAASVTAHFSTIRLRDLLAGKQEANPYVQPGDIVSIPDADQFFVTGAVVKPGAFPLNTKMTLTQAIALAGGVNLEGSRSRVRIVRQLPNSDQRNETVHNVDAILRRKAQDVALLPNDIIEVPGSTTRVAARSLLGTGINMLNTLPFFIVR